MIVIRPIDFEEAQKRLENIPGAGAKAVSLSINFGLKKSKTEISRELRQFYAIKQKDIYQAIPDNAILWSNPATLKGKMDCVSSRLPAILFNPKPSPTFGESTSAGGKVKQVNLRRGRQISVEIRKGQRVNVSPRAFYAKGRGGRGQIFVRQGAARFPIRAVVTLSVSLMLASHKVMPKVSNKVRGLVNTELMRQVDRFLKK